VYYQQVAAANASDDAPPSGQLQWRRRRRGHRRRGTIARLPVPCATGADPVGAGAWGLPSSARSAACGFSPILQSFAVSAEESGQYWGRISRTRGDGWSLSHADAAYQRSRCVRNLGHNTICLIYTIGLIYVQ
jgi:hypothetical protein